MSLDDDRFQAGGSRRGRIVFWSMTVVIVGVAAWWLMKHREGLVPVPQAERVESTPSEGAQQEVVLYFADAQARGLVTESREVIDGEDLEEDVEVVVGALIGGPTEDGVPVLPAETRLEQTFFAEESSTLYLDFNAALVTRHPGGSAAEYHTISALVRTIGANFKKVARVQILVDGQPIDTLAGHFDTSRPIEIATWR